MSKHPPYLPATRAEAEAHLYPEIVHDWYNRDPTYANGYYFMRCAADVPKPCYAISNRGEVSIPSHQCCRPAGHGPEGLFCKQHARMAEAVRQDADDLAAAREALADPGSRPYSEIKAEATAKERDDA